MLIIQNHCVKKTVLKCPTTDIEHFYSDRKTINNVQSSCERKETVFTFCNKICNMSKILRDKI